jgi:hypothetical protein
LAVFFFAAFFLTARDPRLLLIEPSLDLLAVVAAFAASFTTTKMRTGVNLGCTSDRIRARFLRTSGFAATLSRFCHNYLLKYRVSVQGY